MPTLKTKDGEIQVSTGQVVRMADRMHRLGNKSRRDNFLARAKKRIEAGPCRKADVATVIAAGR
jgi:hypothetical protein